MKLELKRDVVSSDFGTFGKLYVDDVLECETLEDEVREVDGEPVSAWKINGKTAIPRGRYRVIITRSLRFGRDMPLLLDVPGFQRVRIIYSGITTEDTEGCIFLGTLRGQAGLFNGRVAFREFFDDLRNAINAGEEVWIDIA